MKPPHQDACDYRRYSGEHECKSAHQRHVDPGEDSGAGVAASGKELLAEGGAVQKEHRRDADDDQDDHRIGELLDHREIFDTATAEDTEVVRQRSLRSTAGPIKDRPLQDEQHAEGSDKEGT